MALASPSRQRAGPADPSCGDGNPRATETPAWQISCARPWSGVRGSGSGGISRLHPTAGSEAPMSISMYQAAVPAFLQMLNSLSAVLDKAEAHAAERKIDPAVLLQLSPRARHVPADPPGPIATDHAKGCCARWPESRCRNTPTTRTRFADLRARIARTVEFVRASTRGHRRLGGARHRLTARQSAAAVQGPAVPSHFALPNFYFHTTAAYASCATAACRSASATSWVRSDACSEVSAAGRHGGLDQWMTLSGAPPRFFVP